jgi:hypothetical protein
MGGGCRNIPNRETIFAGGKCDNNCFSNHGGCNASDDVITKSEPTCELMTDKHEVMLMSIEEINSEIDGLTHEGKSVFLYTPDLFSNYYLDRILHKLPNRNGNTYIAVNAGVRSLIDCGIDFQILQGKGIREVWIGVESAVSEIRDIYKKPAFTNQEVIQLTQQAKIAGLNMCWYMVDGKEDNPDTRSQAFQLIKEGNPFRVNIEQLQ